MKVLLSIKPEYADKILTGEKLFEFRKAVFKNKAVKTVIIYATMPLGKVVGEFDIDEIFADSPSVLWTKTSESAGISKLFFNEYFNGRNKAYAIKVSNPRRYDIPFDLKNILSHGIPPQSFCYLP